MHKTNVEDFTGKELAGGIEMMLTIAKEQKVDVEVPEKFANKAEQGSFIDKVSEVLKMKLHRVVKADKIEGAKVDTVMIVATDYVTPEAEEDKKPPAKVAVKGGPVSVVLKNGTSRVYTRAEHGPKYAEVAKQFAEHHGGTIL